jgi:hypothetical protein
MKNTVTRFGLFSGAILAVLGGIQIVLYKNDTLNFGNGHFAGFASMFLAFLMVFFGIRAYREKDGGGAISFGRAFKVGILITLITCTIYVIAWEIIYYGFMPDFMDNYSKYTLDKMRAAGESAATITTKQAEMARFAEMYKNPLVNIPLTFLEIFPVGLIVTLVSAAILRRKPSDPAAAV